MIYVRLSNSDIRLSRLDIAFDIFNLLEIVFLQQIKGGVSHKVFFGRGGNIQVRLYDKNLEILGYKRSDKFNLKEKNFWWRACTHKMRYKKHSY